MINIILTRKTRESEKIWSKGKNEERTTPIKNIHKQCRVKKLLVIALNFIYKIVICLNLGGNESPNTKVLSLDLDSMTWSRLTDLPSPAASWPAFVQDGGDILLVNPYHNNVMLFNQEDLTFTIVTGQGTGVNGGLSLVIPVMDENLHGC